MPHPINPTANITASIAKQPIPGFTVRFERSALVRSCCVYADEMVWYSVRCGETVNGPDVAPGTMPGTITF